KEDWAIFNGKEFVRVYSYLVLRHLDIPKIYALILTDKKGKALKTSVFCLQSETTSLHQWF
ncbi:hypothetical protein, partial [Enterococcus faecium]